MAKGLFLRGYMAFLRRFLYGFVEDDPSRHKKRKHRIRGPRIKKARLQITSPIPRTRRQTTPLAVKTLKVGEIWKQHPSGSYIKMQNVVIPLSPLFQSVKVCQDFKNPGPPFLTGGPFTSVKMEQVDLLVRGIGNYATTAPSDFGFGFGNYQYRGGFQDPQFVGVDWTDTQLMSTQFLLGNVSGYVPSLSPYHPLVDKMLRPKLNHADLGQSLAEIREIPRMLETSARDFASIWKSYGAKIDSKRLLPKEAANSFLNDQFGWLPFIRDIGDVCDVVVNGDRFVRDITNRNGRWDHRERVIEEKTQDTIVGSGSGLKINPWPPNWNSLLRPGSSWNFRYQYLKREQSRVWATGDFKFYKPSFDMSLSDYDSGWNQIRRLSTILGTDISPSLLYKITPWSWLLDYFGNLGSIIDRITAASYDGVVSKNVFLMVSYHRDLVLTQDIDMADRPFSVEFTRKVNSKQRGHAATPYSFGLLPNQLSGKQLAILAALGITRFS